MNQKIVKELVSRVGTDCSGKWISIDNIEKLSELIVQECGQTLVNNTPVLDLTEDWNKGYDRAMNDCIHLIYEHFGVE